MSINFYFRLTNFFCLTSCHKSLNSSASSASSRGFALFPDIGDEIDAKWIILLLTICVSLIFVIAIIITVFCATSKPQKIADVGAINVVGRSYEVHKPSELKYSRQLTPCQRPRVDVGERVAAVRIENRSLQLPEFNQTRLMKEATLAVMFTKKLHPASKQLFLNNESTY